MYLQTAVLFIDRYHVEIWITISAKLPFTLEAMMAEVSYPKNLNILEYKLLDRLIISAFVETTSRAIFTILRNSDQ